MKHQWNIKHIKIYNSGIWTTLKKPLLFFLALSANNSSCRARALLISDYDCVMHNEIAPLLLHTVSFDWFLSGLEQIIYLELGYKNFWYFTRNYYEISDIGLTLPHFEFFSLYLDMFDQNWSFLHNKQRFWSKRLKNSKWGRIKPRSDIP